MDEIKNNELDLAEPEEIFDSPAVVEKINLSDIAKEKNQIQLEEKMIEKQHEIDEINKVFQNLINSMNALSEEDIEDLSYALDSIGKKDED